MSEANKVGTHGRASVLQNRNTSTIQRLFTFIHQFVNDSTIQRFNDYSVTELVEVPE